MRVKISLLVLGSLTTSGVTSMALSDQAAVWTMWGNCDCSFFFFLMIRPPPTPTLFPYPPLFRSVFLVADAFAPQAALRDRRRIVGVGGPINVRAILFIGHFQVSWYLWRTTAELALVSAGRVLSPDRKSTRLNSSHSQIPYAVFCL